MINLFNIPNYSIDTSKFSNLLHDNIVNEFENEFAEYVGAKYAVGLNSATSAIFLLFLNKGVEVSIPSVIPPVVANAILTSGNKLKFNDNVNWIGNSYLLHNFGDYKIIDSAQKVQKNQYSLENCKDKDIIIYSFYPTKPVGSCDGGMIVSNNKESIDRIRCLAYNGMSCEVNNWERKISAVGYKMYMSTIQAYIAYNNFIKIDRKNDILTQIRDFYNESFYLNNNSLHLYIIYVSDRDKFILKAKENGINCGIHYKALHLNKLYGFHGKLLFSEICDKHIVSIPFHENLTESEIEKVIKFVKFYI